MPFRKPGKLFLKTTWRNDKKVWLRESRLCWIMKVVAPSIGFKAVPLSLPYILYLYSYIRWTICVSVNHCTYFLFSEQNIKKRVVAQDFFCVIKVISFLGLFLSIHTAKWSNVFFSFSFTIYTLCLHFARRCCLLCFLLSHTTQRHVGYTETKWAQTK